MLLNVVENDAGGGAEDETGCATEEDLVGGLRRCDGLGDGIVEVANLDGLRCLVEYGETVASNKDRAGTLTTLADAGRVGEIAAGLARQRSHIKGALVSVDRGDNDGALGRVEAERARRDVLVAETLNTEQSVVGAVL